MRIFFIVPGEPVGYLRMTQGQLKLMRIPFHKLRPDGLKILKQIEKYFSYKTGVRVCSSPYEIDRKPKIKAYLNVMIYFRTRKHPDPGNVLKGIEDALFENDNRVAGGVDFDYDPERPRVEVEIIQ